jgi:RecA/RadA recombinase
MEFPALADRYGVVGVPKVVINEVYGFEGARPEEVFLQNVLEAASQEQAVRARDQPLSRGSPEIAQRLSGWSRRGLWRQRSGSARK